MTKNIMITGANGFIGSFLAEKLVKQGIHVRCAVRRTSDLSWLKGLSAELYYLDWHDPDSLKNAVQNQDVIYHLAGVTKAKQPSDYFEGNVDITKRLLEAYDRYGPLNQKFIYVSSQAAAGPSKDGTAVSEADDPSPVSIYGQAKLETENVVLAYSESRWATVIRPPSVYGPRDRDVFAMFQNVNRGILAVLGDGKSSASLVHVFDLVDGIELAGQHDAAKSQVFFISGNGVYDWATIGNLIAHALGKKPVKIRIPFRFLDGLSALSEMTAKFSNKPALLNRDKVREMKQKYWICTNEKSKKVLGFQPNLSLEKGIHDTAKWYQDQGWLS